MLSCITILAVPVDNKSIGTCLTLHTLTSSHKDVSDPRKRSLDSVGPDPQTEPRLFVRLMCRSRKS
jgi:hypothetical protein